MKKKILGLIAVFSLASAPALSYAASCHEPTATKAAKAETSCHAESPKTVRTAKAETCGVAEVALMAKADAAGGCGVANVAGTQVAKAEAGCSVAKGASVAVAAKDASGGCPVSGIVMARVAKAEKKSGCATTCETDGVMVAKADCGAGACDGEGVKEKARLAKADQDCAPCATLRAEMAQATSAGPATGN